MPRCEIRRCTTDDWAEIAMVHSVWAAMYEHVFSQSSEVYSGLWDGRLLGAVGFIFHAPGQAYCWGAFLPERWPRYQRLIFEMMRDQRDAVIAVHHLVRLEARADCDHAAACRFLECMEFHCEGWTFGSNTQAGDQFLYAYLTPERWLERCDWLDNRYGTSTPEILQARHDYLLTQSTLYGAIAYRCRRAGGGGCGRGHGVDDSGVECRSQKRQAECATRESGCPIAGPGR